MAQSVAPYAALSFKVEQPVGTRSGHARFVHDGREDSSWDLTIPKLRDEMSAFHQNTLDPLLTEAEHIDYWAQICAIMRRCTKGKLSFANPEEGKPLKDLIVELRPVANDRPAFGREPRLVRLYFAEPVDAPQSLLALHVSTKEASQFGLAEQDIAIAEAIARGEAWVSP